MTSSHESPSPDNGEALLSEDLQRQYSKLLRDKAERLEAIGSPDAELIQTMRASFSQFGDGLISFAHATVDGEYSATILYVDPDHPEQGFFAEYQPKTKKREGDVKRYPWEANNASRYSAGVVLQKIDRNWPMMYADSLPQDEVRDFIEKDTDPNDGTEAPAQYIIGLLENSKISSTGEKKYNKKWNTKSKATGYEKVVTLPSLTEVTIRGEGPDDLSRIDAETNITFYPFDIPTTLTCRIQCDEIDNVTVTASYVSPQTGETKVLPIQDHEGLLAIFSSTLDTMIDGKIDEQINQELL